MIWYHVFPDHDRREHQTEKGADCWCEPRVEDEGLDDEGKPTRIFVHHSLDGREHREPDHVPCAQCPQLSTEDDPGSVAE